MAQSWITMCDMNLEKLFPLTKWFLYALGKYVEQTNVLIQVMSPTNEVGQIYPSHMATQPTE